MRFDKQNRGSRFKPNAPFDSYNRIPHMDVTTDGKRSSDGLQLLNDGYGSVFFSIESHGFSFFKSDLDWLRVFSFEGRRVGVFWEWLIGSQGFCSAHTGTPKSLVDRIFGFFPRHGKALGFQIIDFFLSRKLLITDGGYDFNLRSHDLKNHIKTHLIVPGSSTSVSNGIRTNFLCIGNDFKSLYNSLCGYGERIGAVAKHITVEEILHNSLVIGF